MRPARPPPRAAARRPFRVFVTATDTGVGKTQVAAALLSLLADAGLSPAPFKPYESGCTRLARPADALELRAAARSTDSLDQVCVHRFRAPLAPGVAAARMGAVPDLRPVLAAFDLCSQRLHALERRLAVRSGRVIGNGTRALSDGRQHSIAVGNGFIAGERDNAFNGSRRGDGFAHELPV